MSDQAKKQTQKPRQPARCLHHQLLITKDFVQFENEIKMWISTCVASRTISEGKPIRREATLVNGNSSLKNVWLQAMHMAATRGILTIRADYKWHHSGGDNWRVEEITFSTQLPRRPKAMIRHVDPQKSIEIMQAQWRAQWNSLITSVRMRDQAAKEVERLKGWVDDDRDWQHKVADKFIDGATSSFNDRKFSAIANYNSNNHAFELYRKAKIKLIEAESEVQVKIKQIKRTETSLCLLMNEKELEAWLLRETSLYPSFLYGWL